MAIKMNLRLSKKQIRPLDGDDIFYTDKWGSSLTGDVEKYLQGQENQSRIEEMKFRV